MSNSLWPDAIRSRILSPMAILKEQADALTRQTVGILMGAVIPKEEGEKAIVSLDIVVPALNDYRHRILQVGHKKDFPYPCVVEAEVFRSYSGFRVFLETGMISDSTNTAATDMELRNLIAKAIQFPQVISIAQSLITRATDVLESRKQQDRDPSVPRSEPSSDLTSDE